MLEYDWRFAATYWSWFASLNMFFSMTQKATGLRSYKLEHALNNLITIIAWSQSLVFLAEWFRLRALSSVQNDAFRDTELRIWLAPKYTHGINLFTIFYKWWMQKMMSRHSDTMSIQRIWTEIRSQFRKEIRVCDNWRWLKWKDVSGRLSGCTLCQGPSCIRIQRNNGERFVIL